MARVLVASWERPVNAEHGYYVQVRVDGRELRAGIAEEVARQRATQDGYAPAPFTVGYPVCQSWPSADPGEYTQAFWFRRRAT